MTMIVRKASAADLPLICSLVEEVFQSTVAPYYTSEGIRTFRGYVDPERLKERISEGCRLLVAEDDQGGIAGMIMTKGGDHISLFFVREQLHRRGVGRALLDSMIEELKNDDPALERITVNSSPNSVEAYRRMGFTKVEEEKALHGISFTRMERIISSWGLP